MKRSSFVLLSLALLSAVAVSAGALRASTDGTTPSRAARVAKLLAGKTFSVVKAVDVAEAKTGGTAIEVEVEVEDGRAIVEVEVLVPGETPRLLEVEVDGGTNEILEVEDEDDEDDQDDGDDGDDDANGDDDGR